MIKIKQATLLDSQLLSSIHTYAFKDLQKPWSSDVIYNTMLNKNNYTLIAYSDDNQPLGFIIYSLIPQIESEVLTICSVKSRSGSATLLMNQMIKHAKLENIGKILLEVACDNIKAISLYEKLGFQEIALRKNYYKRDNNIFINAKIMILEF